MTNQAEITISIFGSGGGVAKSLLSILNRSFLDANDPIHSLIGRCTLHFVDRKQRKLEYYKTYIPDLIHAVKLHQFDLNDPVRVRRHLTDTNTAIVIDVSWADTVQMMECCHETGAHYINSALENTMVDETEELEGFTLLERYLIFERHRKRFTRMKAIVGSGMNPGVVQWMAVELMRRHPEETPLGCYIVEHDSSFYADKSAVRPKTVYSTWSTECFLDEAILNYPMFMQRHTPLIMYSAAYELEFKVTLGGKQFYGCLMPHEEVITLGKAYDMETGFIYRVNDYTTDLLRAHIDQANDLWDWNHKVLDPAEAELEGEDMVGVLLVYPDRERYMYNVMSNKAVYAKYKTNATYFQVACGLYGALSSLLLDDIPDGVYFVDELLLQTDSGYGNYLSYYMQDFTTGENGASDGLLLDRMKREG
ncbi:MULTISPECIES: saccharopine dehydrogenase NADP-binding domain-containing protein [unclassified Paenibacillus]|uniref:saccharopine dehydrogenase NADP-binding domain-containing protein n=1 Tax=unclassified Paenibacillus TaxID=185978 RepID=UPI001C10C8A1|nr:MULTISPECIES: saccharopine dehydrogenase NADP-binding domain-containing protein [unclassified Paenibacillus]MBU5443204.1 saccharopine dehydrogenase NADP-binding domain-containing protein [Paenibacillus sp. MSJ-34]CAH0121396.1 hypothetical protein PAE9249_03924 [Paenibacillus sp. CECT 9249]